MSTNHATLKEGYDFDLVTKGLAVKAVRFKEWVFGFNDSAEPADTSAKMATADDTKRWLASIVGAFDNNPLYTEILENERIARLRDDEQFITLE